MHDPLTVAFEIRYPWKKYRNPRGPWEKDYRAPFITIWHRDPERKGDDDSCDWFWRNNLTAKERAMADDLVDNEVDNLRSFFSQFITLPCDKHQNREDCYDANCHLGDWMPICDLDEMRSRVRRIMSIYKKNTRWHYPVRWHFWHWSFQCHPLQAFKRWAFSRCNKCGKGFSWGYSPCSNSWNSDGPKWFRSEPDVFHSSCDRPADECVAQSAVSSSLG
jgi:hypothetical protein